ncbi:MAG: efflux RND transporter periplasmic adaptor subunit, partial [Rubellimicrobium sp.]|nr:efflux RND transporter periplasmic adaptor subunit [Rubellimicrobium sp.]
IAPTIDTTTRLGEARISLDQPEALRPGLFLSAEILIDEVEMLAVPVSAVGAADGATVMQVSPDGVVSRVPVVTGVRDGPLIGVVEGIGANEMVVTRAGAFVRHGDRITPVHDDVTAAQAAATEGG